MSADDRVPPSTEAPSAAPGEGSVRFWSTEKLPTIVSWATVAGAGVQIVTVVVAFFALLPVYQDLNEGRQRANEDSFLRAVDQLSSDNIAAHVLAIRSLQALADQGQPTRRDVMDVYSDFLRSRLTRPADPNDSSMLELCTPDQTWYDRVQHRDLNEAFTALLKTYQADRTATRQGNRYRLALPGTCLHFVDLTGVDLSGADFSQADLAGAILNKTVLTCADLHEAFLQNTEVHEANLSGANLTSTIVKVVKPGLVSFDKVDLRGAKLGNARFSTETDGDPGVPVAAVDTRDASMVRTYEGTNYPTLLLGRPITTAAALGTVYAAPGQPATCAG